MTARGADPQRKTSEREASESAPPNRWQTLIDIAGKDLIDPDVYKEQRLFETKQAQAAAIDQLL